MCAKLVCVCVPPTGPYEGSGAGAGSSEGGTFTPPGGASLFMPQPGGTSPAAGLGIEVSPFGATGPGANAEIVPGPMSLKPLKNKLRVQQRMIHNEQRMPPARSAIKSVLRPQQPAPLELVGAAPTSRTSLKVTRVNPADRSTESGEAPRTRIALHGRSFLPVEVRTIADGHRGASSPALRVVQELPRDSRPTSPRTASPKSRTILVSAMDAIDGK